MQIVRTKVFNWTEKDKYTLTVVTWSACIDDVRAWMVEYAEKNDVYAIRALYEYPQKDGTYQYPMTFQSGENGKQCRHPDIYGGSYA